MEESPVKNKYTYNGKEFQEDLGINLHYYGFRVYDPAIGRFTSVDPITEEFAHLSTFNYADNSPIANIDLHGLQAVYAADGKLIQYSVQQGQGPTQIAQDLQENYRCQLSCDADWTQIVYDNGADFQNVFDGDGNVTDKFNEDFESGNIETGTILEISDGREVESTMNEEKALEKINKSIDSLKKVNRRNRAGKIAGEHGIKEGFKETPATGGPGILAGEAIRSVWTYGPINLEDSAKFAQKKDSFQRVIIKKRSNE